LNGHDCYTGTWGSPEADAAYDSLIAEWLKNGRRLPARFAPADARGLTIAELAIAYDKHAEASLSHQRWKGNVGPALRRLLAAFGDLAAASFEPRHLRDLRRRMVDEVDADGNRLSRGYINKGVISQIKTVFAWAADDERGLVPPSVYHAIKLVKPLKRKETPAPETEPVRPVADAVVEATLEHLSDVVADMVRVQRLTGARPGEVCMMRWADIEREGEVWMYRPAQHKTAHHGKTREIAIGPRAQAVLMKYQARGPADAIFSPAEAEAQRRAKERANRTSPMTPSQEARGAKAAANPRRRYCKRYATSAYGLAIARAVRAAYRPAGMGDAAFAEWECPQHWHPNQLRHTHATATRRDPRFGLEAAGAVLGHSKVDVTQLYAERQADLAEQVALAVG
jgi:integrase